jgi:hypothetical protein
LANLVEIWQILLKFLRICIEKLWHHQVEFLQQWKMGFCFDDLPDVLVGYKEILVFLTKVGV